MERNIKPNTLLFLVNLRSQRVFGVFRRSGNVRHNIVMEVGADDRDQLREVSRLVLTGL